MKILVTQRIAQAGLDLLSGFEMDVLSDDGPPATERVVQGVSDKVALLSLVSDRVDERVLEAGRNLRIISNFGVGFDNIDVTAATRRGVLVTNTPDVLTETTADLTWALLMAVARRVVEADRWLRDGQWRSFNPSSMLGTDVFGKTLGIVGHGRIGRAVAARAQGFGMRIVTADRQRSSLEDVLRTSDFVSIHAPLSDATRHLIGARELACLQPHAYLINTSRGPLVDTAALIVALREGRLKGAALDVFEDEPNVPPELVAMPNCVLTPHIGSASIETRTKMAVLAAQNLLAALDGHPQNVVNPQVLSR